ncbi:MAG TPA: SCO family protein [Advenella kashmirensis]|uniref:SCO family protein n=1 Tax=Advenella kashmirensis TaxID=310575 RepID=A0A356LIZ1_9BURK|nr:SCO family protein [Advenella kashmirensis]
MKSFLSLRFATRTVLAMAMATALAACDNNASDSAGNVVSANATAGSFTGSDITGTGFGKDIELVDQNGTAIQLQQAYRGKVMVIFFGFTQCPDVCPTTMAELAQVREKLEPEQREQVQVIMISVDPQRDTPAVMKQYVSAFDPSFVGLTGSDEQIAKVASSFKAYYKKVDSGQSYTMEHSSGLYVLDTEGESRLLIKPNTAPEAIAADIQKLL